MPTFGELLRQQRHECGLSLRDLERRAPASRSQLSDLERGHRMPTLALAANLDRVLDAHGALLAVAVQASKEAEMRRRTILAALTAVGGGAAVAAPLASLEAVRQGMTMAMGDLPDADEWESIVAGYIDNYYMTAPAELIPRLSADLLVLQQVIDADRDPCARRGLNRTAAQLCTIMAMTLGSAGQAQLAGRWWSTAGRAAERAGDVYVLAWTRGREAVRGLYERRRPARLISDVDQALDQGRPPCAGTMELLGGKAQALSMLGRAADAVTALAELDEAFARLPAAVTSDDSIVGWAEYCLWHTRSYVFTHLGDTASAYVAQERALAMYPPELYRQAAMVRLHRSRCLVMDGHLADGLAEGSSALDELEADYRSGPVAELGHGVLRALPSAERARPAADELRQRLAQTALV